MLILSKPDAYFSLYPLLFFHPALLAGGLVMTSITSDGLPAYYIAKLDGCLTDYMRSLFINYSKIAPDEIDEHLYAIVRKSVPSLSLLVWL
jgi:hypothetical protein